MKKIRQQNMAKYGVNYNPQQVGGKGRKSKVARKNNRKKKSKSKSK